MTLNELNNNLNKSLKKYIKDRKHIRTGKLYNSINFQCSDTDTIHIHFSSMFYIQYLENRTFVDKYFASQEFNDIVAKYTVESMSRFIFTTDLQQ
jgi:hypothetical protein